MIKEGACVGVQLIEAFIGRAMVTWSKDFLAWKFMPGDSGLEISGIEHSQG